MRKHPAPDRDGRPERSRRALVVALLVVGTLLVFARLAGADFVSFDDPKYVTDNAHVRTGLTLANVRWALTATHASNWHPLTWVSHMADVELFGLRPAGHHLVSVALHAVNAALLFLLLLRMTGALGRSAFVAALFAIHPLHVESVAWVAERKDVLSTLFGFLALLAYVRHAALRTTASYLLVTVLFALSLLAKPMWVTFPFLALLLDVWPLGRLRPEAEPSRGKRRAQPAVTGTRPALVILEKLPWLSMSLASSAVTYLAQRGAMEEAEALGLGARIGNALVSYVRYAGKMLWPAHLAVFYPHPGDALPLWQPILAAVAIAIATTLAWRARRERPYLLVGWLFYLGTLVPVIGLVQVGTQAIADRYTYLPLVGLFVIVAWGAVDVARGARQALPYAGAAVVCALAVVTFVQAGAWRDTRTLFAHAIAVSGNLSGFRSSLGYALQSEGKLDDAIVEYREALRLDPKHMPAIVNLAAALTAKGDVDEATALYERGLSIRPEDAELQNDLGVALRGRGRLPEAEAHFREAIRVRPDYAIADFNLGTTLAGEGKGEAALDPFSKAIALDPHNSGYHNNLGAVLAGLGRVEEAETHYRQALALDPRSARAHNNLGVALAGERKLDEAIAHYEEAIRIEPGYANAHANLAKALVAKGDSAGAWREVHAARRLGGKIDPGLVDSLSRLLPEPPE